MVTKVKAFSKVWSVDGRAAIACLECAAVLFGLSSIVMAAFSGADYALVLLPAGYLLFLLVLGQDNIVKWAPGICVLNVVLFLRFVVMPMTMCLTGETSVYILDRSNLGYGVPLMLYELLGIGAVLKFTSKKQRSYFARRNVVSARKPRYEWFIVLVVLLFLFAIAYTHPYLVSGFSLLTEGTVSAYGEEDLASGLIVSLWDSLLAWLYVWLLVAIHRSVKSEKTAILLSVAITYGYLLMVYIGQVSVSRWHTLIAFVAGLFCLLRLYPTYKKTITVSTLVPVLILIVSASAFKNTSYSWSGIDYSDAFSELFDVSTFDIYLAGPATVSDGVTMYMKGVCDIGALLVDVLQNLPFVDDLVDSSLSTIYQYHLYLGRGDLIMPIIGQSMIYFGWPFAPVISMVTVYGLRLFDRAFLHSPTLPHVYIAGFAGAWLGIGTILNVTITMSWLGLRIFPFYLLIALVELIGGRVWQRKDDKSYGRGHGKDGSLLSRQSWYECTPAAKEGGAQ